MVVWVKVSISVAIVATAAGSLTGQKCSGSLQSQLWTIDTASGQVKDPNNNCITAAPPPYKEGSDLQMKPCATPPTAEQRWAMQSSGSVSLVLASDTSACANLESYGKSAGSTVWLYKPCTDSDCEGTSGNCRWIPQTSNVTDETPVQLVNPGSGLCLDSRGAPPPPPPPPAMPTMRTCAKGSPAASMDFCDTSKSMVERAAALVANLTMDEKLSTFMLTGQLQGIPRLNIKRFRWDATDIEGVDDQVFRFNNTCYPHAIGIGATWDRELIEEIGQITAIEARVLEEKYWVLNNGTYIGATNFDGGPLANVAYDPRVGRTSEMYGECPYHAGQVGMISTLALQNKTTPLPNGDYFLQTSQVTRHFITDHGSNPDNGPGNYFGSLASLEDEFLPPFKAFQVDGEAEGIMFSISALNGMADTANTYLYDKLRREWGSNCIAQTDCCGTFNAAVGAHHNFKTSEDAVAAAINAGIQLDYGDRVGTDITNAINASKITQAQFDAAVARAFLVRFRLGEFDEERNPFWQQYDQALLDCPAHRLHARKAVGASAVLLRNLADALPLSATGLKKVAVVGPWSDRKDRAGGYGGSQGYLNNYKGQPSYINTVLDAVQEQGTASGFNVVYAQGGDQVGNTVNQTAIQEAIAAMTGADVVIMSLGLGNDIEGEGLDRSFLTLPVPQQALLDAMIAAKTDQTQLVVAMMSAGGVDLNLTGIDALVQLWYGGQETGHGLTDVLWGRVNPSGRLPLTVHKSGYLQTGVGPVSNLNMTFVGPTGKLQGRTYRYLSSQADDAVFSFGWGLSYTQFGYSNLEASSSSVNVTVTNLGHALGAEVAELYLGLIGSKSALPPVKHALAGFEKVTLAPGASTRLQFSLRADQLTVIDENGTRQAAEGTVTVAVAGHLPSDPRAQLPENAKHVSNVALGQFSM